MDCGFANSNFAAAGAPTASPSPAQGQVAQRFRAVAIFADDLKEWRCEFSVAQGAATRSPAQIVEKLFQALVASGEMSAQDAPEINFAIAHESARALTAAGKARRSGGDAVPFVLMVTGAH